MAGDGGNATLGYADAKAAFARIRFVVRALCTPSNELGSMRWVMSIPAEPDRDPDLVITESILKAEVVLDQLHAERDRLAAEVARLEGEVRESRQLILQGASAEETTPHNLFWRRHDWLSRNEAKP